MPNLNIEPNRLINEKSPYLLQHAHNPVDWYPWGPEAFAHAVSDDKPIFLSIGYSTCHWCHVMERESFEDEEVAAILNKEFVPVKVDREERPDIDHIYMTVCQSMTGHGGWPLTIIMTPDKKPFFAGTYFPKNSRGHIPGLVDVLTQISRLWQSERAKILSSGNQIASSISAHLTIGKPGKLTEEMLHRTFESFRDEFDQNYGGFSSAPKFPTPHILGFLLRYWKTYGEKDALDMVEKTLEGMARGGIYDHIGFGFARYSTDRKWLVPHFEKMLYDNALLAVSYIETYQATKKSYYREIAEEILSYILRDMTSPEGGFFAAEDADSEGEEGKFYVWTPDEVKEILGDESGERFSVFYDIKPSGNFEGKSIPNLISQEDAFEQRRLFKKERQALFEAREKRIHPFKDDKILTAWNGLMIAAMALAARVFNEPTYRQAAENAAQFILKKLRRNNGRLLARYREGEAQHLGYVDDYAFLTWGLIELYQASFQPKYLKEALTLSQNFVDHFWDEENGGFFLYGNDSEQLLVRPKEVYDGATPSGNSVSALNFFRLARLTGETKWEETAQQILETFGGAVKQSPAGYTHLLMALQFVEGSSQEIVLTGDP
ncbi:MAG: thioredoxin domain-containing protein, partial [Desulfitobacteriaceae bacterium]|nr:thioredoxin domain-containing protein [Desulfitobacteriaceae bacterium]